MNPGIDTLATEIGVMLQTAAALGLLSILELGDLPFWQLAALAFLFRFGIERLPLKTTRWFAPSGAGLAMLTYFAHCVLKDQGDFEDALVALIRSLLVYQVVWGVLTVLDGSRAAIIARCQPAKRLASLTTGVQSGAAFTRRLFTPRRKPRSLPPRALPPSLSRAERMQQLARAAQADYEAEAAALASLPLDSDELEILELQAKQRLLEKISRIAEG